MREDGWTVTFCHSPDITQNTVSSGWLCFPLRELDCLVLYIRTISLIRHHHHHHHVHEGLGVFPVPQSSNWIWSLHLFFGRPIFLHPFVLYCNACFSVLFVSILCPCCSHFFWCCFISFTMFCAPVFSPIYRFFSLSNFVIPTKCLKNFICAASERYPLFSSVPKLHFQISMLLQL